MTNRPRFNYLIGAVVLIGVLVLFIAMFVMPAGTGGCGWCAKQRKRGMLLGKTM